MPPLKSVSPPGASLSRSHTSGDTPPPTVTRQQQKRRELDPVRVTLGSQNTQKH